MDGLTHYHVTYKDSAEDEFTQVFSCWAEDAQHAYEQTRDAEPDAVLLVATRVD